MYYSKLAHNVKQLETVPEIKILNFTENIFPVWFQAAVV